MSNRILVIDDEPSVTFDTRKSLERGGYSGRVDESNDSLKAYELLTSGEYSLAICDTEMPGMTGLELLAKVGIEKSVNVHFIGRSGKSQYEEQWVGLGAEFFHHKMVNVRLLHLIGKYLNLN